MKDFMEQQLRLACWHIFFSVLNSGEIEVATRFKLLKLLTLLTQFTIFTQFTMLTLLSLLEELKHS